MIATVVAIRAQVPDKSKTSPVNLQAPELEIFSLLPFLLPPRMKPPGIADVTGVTQDQPATPQQTQNCCHTGASDLPRDLIAVQNCCG